MESAWLIVLIVAAYIAILAVISFLAGRSSRTSNGFTSGGKVFPAILIGFLLASEFIGTTASIGTAQEAYSVGISAAWNIVSLGVGFILFAFLAARRYSALGENTISGALARTYGSRVRTATSVIMVCALLIVAVSVYASGGAVLASLLDINRYWAIVLVGVLATIYVSIGGMRSVVYTNFVHAVIKMVGIIIVAVIGYQRVGGMDKLRAAVPPEMFAWHGVGWSQIMAWMIAGVGAIFATQYVVQAVTTVGDDQKARRAGFYSALILVPYGILAAFIGMCSSVLYPHIKSIQALPAFVVDIDPLLAGVVVAGLCGAMFGTIAALTIGSSTLLLKDFYQPYFNREGNDRKNVVFLRLATLISGLIPISLALFASDVLTVTFLAKSLRAALAVLVLLMFYAPRYGTKSGAFWTIILALPATIGWFLAGNPFGIDNAYIAVATPLVVMTLSHFFGKRRTSDEARDAPTIARPAVVSEEKS
ncbi:sodium:solute symporter family protein [Saccharopolyspora phatthalungensis]|uniref:SSS family solute:Na+ symporter n=1 Tax=Saccharopolyspora phatthalungensis TaxID=664693 RepID=A0A840QFY9_9PSEU|nr:sodium:solute symporter family protein [Saccharopolyspora phatthalungensis]MBB5158860.1 SSS family solute:Na+ symporter [Saccharopolyspora phatthalungensis]